MANKRVAVLISFMLSALCALLLFISTAPSAAQADSTRSSNGAEDIVFVNEAESDVISGQLGFHSHEVAEGQVSRLYFAYFGRQPDAIGLDYWVRMMIGGTRLDEVSASFAESPEFYRRYGQTTDQAFLELLYRNVLDRPSDAKGLAYWQKVMNQGHGRGQLMTYFSEAPEFVVKTGTTPSDFVDTVKAGTYEQRRGEAALDRLGYSADRYLADWTIEFLPQRTGYYGLTFVRDRHIKVYVRPTQSQSHLEHVVAHEIGHAVDVTRLSSSDRERWQKQRGISGYAWWPGNGANDRSTGAGDFAESFAAWQIQTEHFQSHIGRYPTGADIDLMANLALN